jgi:2-polyprenyl-6-methoxyphenol hydroxylase-like FAD-dependent oxidoreductase
MAQSFQVIIVGGGPVGVGLAVELGQRGISCALVERHLTPQRIPKGQNLTQRTMEHFHFWGIADRLRSVRLLPDGYPIGGITAYGSLMSDYWFPYSDAPGARAGLQSYYYERNERLPQYLTEEVLRDRLAELPNVTTYFGWSAESVTQDDDSVRVEIAEVGSTGRETLEGAFVVGCDGGRSLVREQAGIDRGGEDFDQRMVLAVFRSKELHRGLERFPQRTTYRVVRPDLRGYWQFFGRVDVGEGWFFHAPVPRETTTENYDFLGLIQQAAGFKFEAELDYVGFWDLRVAVARHYRNGRAFIAGDAAHTHPPYGGFGLNAGLEDITNLGWKLQAHLEGWGGDALLDSYDLERRPIFEQTGEEMIARGIETDRVFLDRYNPGRDLVEFERAWKEFEAVANTRQGSYDPHYEGSPVVFGRPGYEPGIHGEPSFEAIPGHHLAPLSLSDGRNVFEALGGGFTLLALGSDQTSVTALATAAAEAGVPLTVISDTFDGGREAYGSRLVLVRPDQFVAWAGDVGPDNVSDVVQRVAGA